MNGQVPSLDIAAFDTTKNISETFGTAKNSLEELANNTGGLLLKNPLSGQNIEPFCSDNFELIP